MGHRELRTARRKRYQVSQLKRRCQYPSHKSPTFIFCSPICPNDCDVVFLWKYILLFEKWFFSFDRSNMQIFTRNITRVVWPHVTNKLDLRYFCQHNPLFYHLNLIPCHYWSWQRNIYFLVTPGYYFLTGAQVLRCVFPSPIYIIS